ncbi:MAG: epimerase [Clostridiales bacterium GWB2_37_7]|nr:MAG: epimerase [Clostridiales bacterium GWB2_37_7]
MSTILVTGGAGFIGSHLVEKLLEYGHKVINLDNFNAFYSPLIKRKNISKAQLSHRYTLVEGDIRDENLLDHIFTTFKIDTVVHIAALAGVRKSIDNPLEYVDVDIKGTVNLLEYSRRYKIKKFVYASTSSVYGLNPTPFKEDDNIKSPVSPYAAAKHAGELFCRTYNILYGLPIICLRFFTVYGPRQRPEMAIHYFTRMLDEGKDITIFGDGTSSRDYTYVDDIVNGIVAAMNLDCAFEIFNLGNSNPIQLSYLIDLIEEKLDKPAQRIYMEMQSGDVEHTYADITKSRAVLGYSPSMPIEEGIERFVDWYKKKGDGV